MLGRNIIHFFLEASHSALLFITIAFVCALLAFGLDAVISPFHETGLSTLDLGLVFKWGLIGSFCFGIFVFFLLLTHYLINAYKLGLSILKSALFLRKISFVIPIPTDEVLSFLGHQKDAPLPLSFKSKAKWLRTHFEIPVRYGSPALYWHIKTLNNQETEIEIKLKHWFMPSTLYETPLQFYVPVIKNKIISGR